MSNDSHGILDMLFQIPVNSLYESLLDWLSAREPFANSLSFPAKSRFYTDKPVTIEWVIPARSPRTCDCRSVFCKEPLYVLLHTSLRSAARQELFHSLNVVTMEKISRTALQIISGFKVILLLLFCWIRSLSASP